ncbi:MSH2 protein [Polyrhizophydium stewartii]|uniref:MSH2 protein n=1 Tax=Polyrhizophydium stewartii TaxID=2732419 RepID=A0ABR4NHT6_9FUNG
MAEFDPPSAIGHMDKDQPDLALDKPAEAGFCQFFASLPEKGETTVRLFERNGGDYYSAHGDDALYVADQVYKTTTVIKYLGGSAGLPSCTLSRLNATAFLKDMLVNKHHRIEIWASETRKGGGWRLAKSASPGNLQSVEELLFGGSSEVSSSPIVLAVSLRTTGNDKLVGIAYTDATTMRRMGVAEFVDNETFSNFESVLIQLGVKECVMPDDSQNYGLKKIKAILSRCDVVVTERRRADFGTNDIEQDLNRLLANGMDATKLPELNMAIAMQCVAALIKYLNLLADDSNFGEYTIETHDLSQYMRLDSAAVKALNLTLTGQAGPKSMSLTGLLDKCKTAQGSRLLGQWVKQPLMSVEDIQARHNLVEAFFEDSQLRQTMQEDRLRSFPDLHRLARKFQRGSASLQDVVRVYQVLLGLPALQETLEEYTGEHAALVREVYISPLREYAESLRKLQELVETTVDLEAVENHEYLIKADFHEELQDTRARMNEVLAALQPEAERVAVSLGVEFEKRLKFERNSQYGHHLRLSRADASKIRGKPEFLEMSTQKAGVLFTTQKLRMLSNEFIELTESYEALQGNLAKEVITITGSYFPVLELLNQLIAHIDVIVSFAHVAVHAPIQYVRPKMAPMGDGSGIVLKGARHPCVEIQDDVSFIENDVSLVPGASAFQIITGPNMGGKSTYIRQIGVIVLMAQIGSFVPCQEASVAIVDSILARVGANDSQLKGISTFMAEMLETASILRSATRNSLIIIDELGRGTSTYDGFGLAWAIAEHICTKIKCLSLFATHFHELTQLADKEPSVTNLHVTAHLSSLSSGQKTLTLLYKVLPGVCDQSFGIHVAELASFPEIVVKIAKRKAAELEDFEDKSGGGSGSNGAQLPPKQPRVWASSDEAVRAGGMIVDRFLREAAGVWRAEQPKQQAALESTADGSVSAASAATARLLEALRGLRAKYAGEMAGNEFVQEVLRSL